MTFVLIATKTSYLFPQLKTEKKLNKNNVIESLSTFSYSRNTVYAPSLLPITLDIGERGLLLLAWALMGKNQKFDSLVWITPLDYSKNFFRALIGPYEDVSSQVVTQSRLSSESQSSSHDDADQQFDNATSDPMSSLFRHKRCKQLLKSLNRYHLQFQYVSFIPRSVNKTFLSKAFYHYCF